MSLKKIRDSLREAKKNEHGFSWVDEEFQNLLLAIAEHVLALGAEHEEEEPSLPPNYISLKEFEDRHKFISVEGLRSLLNRFPEFKEKHTIVIDKQRYLNEHYFADYYRNKYPKKLARLGLS